MIDNGLDFRYVTQNERLLRFVYHKGQLLYEGGMEENLAERLNISRQAISNWERGIPTVKDMKP